MQKLKSIIREFVKQPRRHMHWSLWLLAGIAIAWFPFSITMTVAYVVLAVIVLWKCRVTVFGVFVISISWTLAIVFLSHLSFFAPDLENIGQQIPFNAQQWRSGSRDHGFMWPTRLRMADDLVYGGTLTGQSRKKVLKLLGPPDNGERIEPNEPLVYMLGPERGPIRIDSESLYIGFSDDDHVVSLAVHR